MPEVTIGTTTIALPPHTHAEVLTGRDVVTGELLAYPVVWADRTERTCPRCNQPIEVKVPCPVMLNPGAGQGGQVEDLSQQHQHCGGWLVVDSVTLDQYATADDVMAEAGRLASQREAAIRLMRNLRRRRLRRDLRVALAWLAKPLRTGETREDREDEVTTGSDIEPGVYRNDEGVWIAWDFDPDPDSDESDCITVTTTDLEV